MSNLPVSFSWDDRDYICAYNEALRRKVNPIIGGTWRQASKVKKDDLKQMLIKYPELIQDLIKIYNKKQPNSYNFEEDPSGVFAWHKLANEYSRKYPLSFALKIDTPQSVHKLIEQICAKYKQLVEDNGLWEVFWNKGNLRHERIAQLSFFGIADSYCAANNIDISRESNNGRGPVDFKFSNGYNARVTVEVKYSSNTHLLHGWQKQLPRYNKAEKTNHSIYLVIRTNDSTKTIEEIEKITIALQATGKKVPKLFIIDGRPISSASKD